MNYALIVIRTFTRWNRHDGQRLGAALAFYTLLSAAPMLLFLLLAVSELFGPAAGQRGIVDSVATLMGATAGNLTQTFLSGAHGPSHGTVAGVLAIATLLSGASGVFTELRYDLNKMWGARPPVSGIRGVIVQQAFAFLLVLAAGVLLFALMLLSTMAAFLTRFFSDSIHVPAGVIAVLDFLISFALLTLIFALIYRFIPDLLLPSKALWTGAAVTATLFVITKMLLALYLGRTGFGSAYGAAGSLIAIALWVYVSAQIFLLCAEFTYLWSQRGSQRGAAISKPTRRLSVITEQRSSS
jgi:membrane protein